MIQKSAAIEDVTLLIVDDSPTNLGVLFDYLMDVGFKVLVALDGAEALEQIEHIKPDIILLDIVMPGMDGFETCRRLKMRADTREIPVIFMTALTDMQDKLKGFSVGAVDYVTKPVQQEEVLARINTHLTLHDLRKQLAARNTQLQQEMLARIKIEQNLLLRTQELQSRNNELDSFARTVAHDLKNPLSGVIGCAHILLGKLSNPINPEEFVTYLKQIVQAGEKMLNIIEALLLLAGVSKQEVEKVPLDMGQIVQEVKTQLVNMIEEYHAHLVMPTVWPVACGYAPWVEVVWANYISNALKYGGRPPHLELGATPQYNGQIRFWVRDNGNGFSMEAQQRLFMPFTQLNHSNKGYGLGLSIVQSVIKKLGGEVGVESELGKGSLFYFTLSAC